MATGTREDTAIATIKIRLRESLRAEIERSAARAGHSMNAEMISRLQAAYDGVANQSFAFGPDLAGLLLLLAETIDHVTYEAALLAGKTAARRGMMEDPFIFDQVARGVAVVFEAIRPGGDPSPPQLTTRNSDDWQGVDLSGIAENIGERGAATLLTATANLNYRERIQGLGPRAQRIAERLGASLIARIINFLDRRGSTA